MHNDNLHKINEYLSSPFVTSIRAASFNSASKTRRNVTTQQIERKNVVLKTTIHTSSLREPNAIPQKYSLSSVGHVQWV